jgi:ABC-type molybdate transport system substrate-binding protein
VNLVRKNRLALLAALLALFAGLTLSACGGNDSSTGPGGQRNAPSSIVVLADSSLKAAFTQIGQQFETQNPGSTVTFTYGSSATLSQQAVAGDAGDVLATADQQSMVAAQKAQLGSPQVFATKGSNQCQIVTLIQSKNTALSNQFIQVVMSETGQQALQKAGFSGP